MNAGRLPEDVRQAFASEGARVGPGPHLCVLCRVCRSGRAAAVCPPPRVGCRQRLVLERLFEFEFEFELEQPLAFDRLFDLELPPP